MDEKSLHGEALLGGRAHARYGKANPRRWFQQRHAGRRRATEQRSIQPGVAKRARLSRMAEMNRVGKIAAGCIYK
jgi:hypothetical protein